MCETDNFFLPFKLLNLRCFYKKQYISKLACWKILQNRNKITTKLKQNKNHDKIKNNRINLSYI